MSNLGLVLDDIILCIYTLDPIERDYECVPQALHSLYTLASFFGVKIRYSTVMSITNYVRDWNSLTDVEKELIATLMNQLIEKYKNYEYNQVREVAQKILRIAIGAQIELKSAKDALELALNTLYALLAEAVENSENQGKEENIEIATAKSQEISTTA